MELCFSVLSADEERKLQLIAAQDLRLSTECHLLPGPPAFFTHIFPVFHGYLSCMSLCSCFRAYPTKDVVDLAAVPRQHVYSSSGPIELSEEERMTLVAEIDRTRSPSLLVQEPQLIVGPPITPNDRSRATMADATSTSEVPDYTLMISIVQSLMSLPSNGHLTTTVIPRYMAKLCHSLGLSYCKLTALSVSGKFHQNLGTATMGEPDLSFLNVITARAKLDASEALTDRFSAHSTAAIDYSVRICLMEFLFLLTDSFSQGDEPSSRDSTQRQKQGPCQIHGEKPAPCSSFPSLVNIVSRGTRADPLMSIVNEDGSNIGSLPIDWQPMVLTHGLRSITCIPIFSAPPPPSAKAEDSHPLFGQSNLLGCLTLGSTSPLQWQSQGWFSGLSLLVAWTSGLLSTHRSMRMLEFCEQVESSSSIDEMAAAFVHLFPSPSAHDELMQVEVRLALVYSKLNRAAIFVPSPEHPSVSLSQKSSLREGGGGIPTLATQVSSPALSTRALSTCFATLASRVGQGCQWTTQSAKKMVMVRGMTKRRRR